MIYERRIAKEGIVLRKKMAKYEHLIEKWIEIRDTRQAENPDSKESRSAALVCQILFENIQLKKAKLANIHHHILSLKSYKLDEQKYD